MQGAHEHHRADSNSLATWPSGDVDVKQRRRGSRGVFATTLIIMLGIGAFWQGTDGFTAWTAETARRNAVLRSPRPLPSVTLEDQDGHLFTLQDYRGQLLAVEFIYTRCQTICRAQGMVFKQIRDQIPPSVLGRSFSLLSISFDPLHDDPAQLKAYGERFGADGALWRVARIRDQAELTALLKAFGIVVIDDGMGGFDHNAAIHLLGRDGRLSRISDLAAPEPLVEQVRALQ